MVEATLKATTAKATAEAVWTILNEYTRWRVFAKEGVLRSDEGLGSFFAETK